MRKSTEIKGDRERASREKGTSGTTAASK